MSKSDPIKTNYFDAVENLDGVSNLVFYAAAIFSVLPLIIDRTNWPKLYDATSVVFALLVTALFAMGLVMRLYLMPRAETTRLKDFFGKAYGVSLMPEVTDGYYNSPFTKPLQSVAAQTLENALFTSGVSQRMVKRERIKVAVYVLAWLAFVLNRQSDIGVIIVATQVVLSEQILSRWARLEWLSSRAKYVFDELYLAFQHNAESPEFMAKALYYNGVYETAKANASIVLSSKVFNAVNPELTRRWDEIASQIRASQP